MAMTLPTLELFDVFEDGNKERRIGVSRCIIINRFFSLTDKAPPSNAKGPGFKSPRVRLRGGIEKYRRIGVSRK